MAIVSNWAKKPRNAHKNMGRIRVYHNPTKVYSRTLFITRRNDGKAISILLTEDEWEGLVYRGDTARV